MNGVLVGAAIVAVFVGIVWVSITLAGQDARDASRVADIQTLQQGLQTYYTHNQSFPTSLTMLAPKYLGTVPTDPSSGRAYLYTAYATSSKACTSGRASAYHLGAALEGHTAATIAGNSDAPATPPSGEVLCSMSGFDGASNKCLAILANTPEGGDNCYDVVN